jgi:hypothetical protein
MVDETTDEMVVEINATKLQIEEFKESILWQDIKCELDKWKAGASQEYSQVVGDVISGDSGIDNSDMHLGSIYGREKTIDFLLTLPDMFLQILEEKEDGTKSESTD